MAMARDRGYECATGSEVAPAWQRRILASMTWPMFNLITGAAREDAVIDEHFARVFNMDESLTDMMTSPASSPGCSATRSTPHWVGQAALRLRLATGPTGH